MALAVAEANRVLRPGGLLLDIHPAAMPERLELWTQRDPRAAWEVGDPAGCERRPLGELGPDESLDDFFAATEALAAAQVARPGFAHAGTKHFEYRYIFESLDELTEFLEEDEELSLASDDLLERALLALRSATLPARLVLIQPVIVTLLRRP